MHLQLRRTGLSRGRWSAPCLVAVTGLLMVCGACRCGDQPGAQVGEPPTGTAPGEPTGAVPGEGQLNASMPPEEPPAFMPLEIPPAVNLEETAAPLTISCSDSCPLPGCEIVLGFSLPMVVDAQVGSPPELKVVMEPEQAGQWLWRSPTALVFTPAKGALMWGQAVTLRIAEAMPLVGAEQALKGAWSQSFRVPNFEAGGKAASWVVEPGRPRFVGFLNGFTESIGRGGLVMLYDQPVVPAQLAGSFTATSGGKSLGVKVSRLANSLRVHKDTIDPSHLVAVGLERAPKPGAAVSLTYPTWPLVEDFPADGKPTLVTASHDLSYLPRLTLSKVKLRRGNARSAPLRAQWLFGFDRPVSEPWLAEHIEVVPPAEKTSVSYSWEGYTVRTELAPGVEYVLRLKQGFTDVLGNPLDEPVELFFKSRDLDPELKLARAPVTIERQRPAVVTRLRNLGPLTAAARPFASPGDYVRALTVGHKPTCSSYSGIGQATLLGPPVPPEQLNMFSELSLPLDVRTPLVCVELRAPGRGSHARPRPLQDSALLQVTDLGLTTKLYEGGALVWVTRLGQAVPAAGAKVFALDRKGKQLAVATAGADGVARLDSGDLRFALAQPVYVAATLADDTAVVELDRDRVSRGWHYGLEELPAKTRPLDAAVFTDRGAYRPGETVHLKVIVGRGGREAGPGGVKVTVRDARGQLVLTKQPLLDRFGSAALDIALKSSAAVGTYAVQVTAAAGDGITNMSSRTFAVEEYRVPTFEVKVKSDQASWLVGKEAEVVVSARYLHGGSLSGRELAYTVVRDREPFAPGRFKGFSYILGADNTELGEIAAGTLRLDGQGQRALRFPVSHPASAGPMRYRVEASVTDVDRQNYAGRLSRVVHPAAFYVGVKPPPRDVLKSGDRIGVPVVVVHPDGAPVTGVKVRAQLERIDHHSTARLSVDGVEHESHAVDVKGATCLTTTKSTPVTCAFQIDRPGRYRVRAWARDHEGRDVQSGFEFRATGGRPAAWPRYDHERIELIADREVYRPGDTARLVVESPFKVAHGLLTIERDGVLSHRLFEVKGDTPAIEVPITAEHTPNVFVSAVLLRGREHDQKDASGYETGAPSFRMGYVKLRVEPRDRRLVVQVKPSAETANPGAELAVDIEARDHQGKPVVAQATVMVVDEAVLGLTGYKTPDPVAELYADRLLGVRTGASRLDLTWSRRERRERIFAGGDGGDGFAMGLFPDDLRRLFKSTAFFDPAVLLDAEGHARVKLTLPDNLTTYRVMVITVDEEVRAGSAEAKVVVRKPLMVTPVIPRFLYPGDQLLVEAQVFNGTDRADTVELATSFEGLTLRGGKARVAQKVAAGQSATLGFEVTVDELKAGAPRDVTVRFAASMGKERDAVEKKLPLLNPGSKRNLVASALLGQGGEVSLELPAERQPDTARVEVMLSSTALTELKDAVGYLMEYPNGCIEQTTSTAYPLVVLEDLLPEMGVVVDQAALRKFRDAGIKRILSFQTTAGGLSYWPGEDRPHAFATAFGLTALIAAKQRGYDIPDRSLARMADYLEQTLRHGKITGEMPHGGMADADTRALFVMTLGRLGRPQPAYISALWRDKDKLTPFGLAFLAEAVGESKGDKALLGPILDAVRQAAKESSEEAYFASARSGGWSMDSPLRSHAVALLAFADAAPGDAMGGKLLKGLLKRRDNGLWGNTQENVFGIMGVAAIAGSSSAGGAEPEAKVALNGADLDVGGMEKVSGRVRRLQLGESELGLTRGEAKTLKLAVLPGRKGPLNVTLRVQYEAELTAGNRAARSAGFSIERRYETEEGASLDGKPIELGSLVRVRLVVKADAKHNYVAIDDKLPAGLEPLNMALATTQQVSLGQVTPRIQRSQGLLSYQEVRDARVAFYVDEMPAGQVEYVYVARATTPGRFMRPAAHVEAMYEPEVAGDTAIDEVTIK